MRRIASTIVALAISGAAGTMAATTITCGIGSLNGTQAWCGMGFIWLVALPVAIVGALLLGGPLPVAFARLHLFKWWHYALGGFVAALPLWFALAKPFASERWQSAGLYDTLNYLGSGVLCAVAYWFIRRQLAP